MTSRLLRTSAAIAIVAAGFAPLASAQTLGQARKDHRTQLATKKRGGQRLPAPSSKQFQLVEYPTRLGPMQAYLSKPTSRGRQPAIIWITGGFPSGGAGPHAWQPQPARNEQSAKVYRERGLLMMYPTLRGTFGNPGHQEHFYGEVDDVIAAAEYLRKRGDVDPERIFLGGHSTGGTLALLAATTGHRFRAVISFGPTHAAATYGQEYLPAEILRGEEARLRAPVHFLSAIRSPTFVIEGSKGNAQSLRFMAKKNKNPFVKFFVIEGASHFDVLAPLNALIADTLAKLGPQARPELSPRVVQDVFSQFDFETGQRKDPHLAAGAKQAPQRPARAPRKDAGAANGAGWLIEVEEALDTARRTKRPVLALFTCSDRGAASKALHEILAAEEFKTWADESLVLLELDFPVRKRQSPKLKLQNVRFKSDCGVRKLPEVLFLDGDGQVLTRVKASTKAGPAAWIKAAKAALAKVR